MNDRHASRDPETPGRSRESAGARTILLFGLPRSGTTWLGKIFDSHPETLYRHEPDSVLHATDIPLFVDSAEHDEYEPLVRPYVDRLVTVRTPKVSSKLPLFPKTYLSRPAFLVRRGLIVLSKIVERYWRPLAIPDLIRPGDRPKVRLVWKSIESNGRLGLFAKALPEARVIHIIRHPCGNLASILRGEATGGFTASESLSEDYGIIRLLLDTQAATSRKLSLEQMRALTPVERLAWIWALTNENVMNATDGAANCTTIRYEDLCADPLEVSRRLFAFARLPWHRQTEDFIRLSTERESRKFHSVFKIPAKAVSRWREELPGPDIDRILAIAGPTAPGRLFAAGS